MKIVASGLKILGKDHIQSQLDAYLESKQYSEICVAFDMVNEEDFTPTMEFFMDQIYETKAKAHANG